MLGAVLSDMAIPANALKPKFNAQVVQTEKNCKECKITPETNVLDLKSCFITSAVDDFVISAPVREIDARPFQSWAVSVLNPL